MLTIAQSRQSILVSSSYHHNNSHTDCIHIIVNLFTTLITQQQYLEMSDPFDPFSLDEEDFEVSKAANASSKSSSDMFNSAFFNEEFATAPASAPVASSVKETPVQKRNVPAPSNLDYGTSMNSDIFAQLFKSPSQQIEMQSPPSQNKSKITKDMLIDAYTNPPPPPPPRTSPNIQTPVQEVQVPLIIQEQMSAIYSDQEDIIPLIDIKGSISIRPSRHLQGKTMYLAVTDAENQLHEIKSVYNVAKEVTDHIKESVVEFVKQYQDQGDSKIYKVEVPIKSDESKPIELVTFTGSEYLRPIPLLVTVKVKVKGSRVRVGVKIRSNPTNEQNITNISVLMAVPPDVSGESMRMSQKEGVWEPIKRVVGYQADGICPGETIDLKMEFDYSPTPQKDDSKVVLPKFPVLVRCFAEDQLSSVQLNLAGGLGDNSLYQAEIEKRYRLFHRKI